jgi:uncharacterized protein YkwD
MKKRTTALIGLIAVTALLGASSASAAHYRSSDSLDEEEVQQRVHELINEERTSRGLEEMEYTAPLVDVADTHSEDMAENWYFGHMRGLIAKYREAGYQCFSAAENIAYTYNFQGDEDRVANQLVDMWMNSPGHRSNILSSSFEDHGIGIAAKGPYVFATQEFC